MVFARKQPFGSSGEGAHSHRDQSHPPSVSPAWGARTTWDTKESSRGGAQSREEEKGAGEPTARGSSPWPRGLPVEPAGMARETPLKAVEGGLPDLRSLHSEVGWP